MKWKGIAAVETEKGRELDGRIAGIVCSGPTRVNVPLSWNTHPGGSFGNDMCNPARPRNMVDSPVLG
jgi:hypothetical protein